MIGFLGPGMGGGKDTESETSEIWVGGGGEYKNTIEWCYSSKRFCLVLVL